MPGARELLRGGEPSRTRADDRDALARLDGRHHGLDPTLVPGAVDDLHLDLLDGDRVLVDPQHARRLARCRAEPTGELWEAVRCVQPLDRVAPVIAVHEVVPVGDEVAERAAVVAERDAAVHAPTRLLRELVFRERLVHLTPVVEPHFYGAARWRHAPPLQEASGLTHGRLPSLGRASLPRKVPTRPLRS